MGSREKKLSFDPAPFRIGIDLVEVGRIRKLFERGEPLQESIFTSEELRCSWEHKDPYVCLAALLAAKEALFKSLGTGLSGEMDWRDVEVQRGTSGTPVLRLWRKTAQLAYEMGVVKYALSLSYTKDYGIAMVLLELAAGQKPLTPQGSIPETDLNLI
ncbi:MAG: holo-ACP synthase [Deltaproteobacteria bacterium]|nr:holo-ACP synthase [Deltaproteobacteria bacterium]